MEKIETKEELCNFLIKEFAECRNNLAKDNTYCTKVGDDKGAIVTSAKYDQTAYFVEVLIRVKNELIQQPRRERAEQSLLNSYGYERSNYESN